MRAHGWEPDDGLRAMLSGDLFLSKRAVEALGRKYTAIIQRCFATALREEARRVSTRA